MQMRTLFGVSVLGVSVLATSAHATLIAKDSYLSGTDRTQGQYGDGVSLKAEGSLVNTGFQTGDYSQGGSGTGNFTSTSGGLTSTSLTDAAGGKVNWLGIGAPDGNARSVARNLSAVQNLPLYYTAQILNRGTDVATAPAAGAFVGMGYTNAVSATGGVTNNGSGGTATLTGFYVGFAGTGGADQGSLVIRSRTSAANGYNNADTVLVQGSATNSTAGINYTVITKAEANYTGGSVDRITYWVNPTNTNSEAAMSASSLATGTFDFYGLQLAGDLARLYYADNPTATTANGTAVTLNSNSFATNAFFDETRLGTTLADVVPTPEPTTLAALAGAGLTLVRRRRRA